MAQLKQDIGMELVYKLRSAFRDCETEMGRMVAQFDVPLSYYYILRTLEDNIGVTQTQIAIDASISPSVASQVIQKMCKADLLMRKADSEDARLKLVYLTSKGTALRDKLNEMCQTRLPQIFNNMTMKDIKTTLSILDLFQKNMRG